MKNDNNECSYCQNPDGKYLCPSCERQLLAVGENE